MIFMENNVCVKIITVQHFKWDTVSVHVAPRPFHALAFRLSGEVAFLDSKANIISTAGDITFVPANYSYMASYTKGEVIAIHFDMWGYDCKGIENYRFQAPKTLRNLFDESYRTWNSRKTAYYYSAVSYFYSILENMRKQQEPSLTNVFSSNFYKAVEHMQKNFTDTDMSISALSDMACMSDTYFRRLFYKNFSMNPLEYLMRLRLEYAERLLASKQYSVEQVAVMSGFNSPKYFCKVIKEVYGCPPSKLFAYK